MPRARKADWPLSQRQRQTVERALESLASFGVDVVSFLEHASWAENMARRLADGKGLFGDPELLASVIRRGVAARRSDTDHHCIFAAPSVITALAGWTASAGWPNSLDPVADAIRGPAHAGPGRPPLPFVEEWRRARATGSVWDRRLRLADELVPEGADTVRKIAAALRQAGYFDSEDDPNHHRLVVAQALLEVRAGRLTHHQAARSLALFGKVGVHPREIAEAWKKLADVPRKRTARAKTKRTK